MQTRANKKILFLTDHSAGGTDHRHHADPYLPVVDLGGSHWLILVDPCGGTLCLNLVDIVVVGGSLWSLVVDLDGGSPLWILVDPG